jgi:glutathione reductase (NADPH)
MPPTAKPGASDYDLIVIGAGSGGLATAKRAASYGARVLIVEADRVGGTCVIRGCIPKKLMVYAAEIGQAIDAGPGYGWQSERAGCDWPLLVRRRNDAVTTLERNHERYLGEAGVELVRGRARLAGPNHVTVGRDPYSTRYVLIATGARPVLPPIAGIEHAITSDGFFELGQRPDRVLLVGSGYIAVELAGILCGLGARVTVVARGDRPLRGFDDDLRAALLARFAFATPRARRCLPSMPSSMRPAANRIRTASAWRTAACVSAIAARFSSMLMGAVRSRACWRLAT